MAIYQAVKDSLCFTLTFDFYPGGNQNLRQFKQVRDRVIW